MAIHLILCCAEDRFATVWGTVCSSWVHMNCFTSCRTLLLPEGDRSKKYIMDANCMVSRNLFCIPLWFILCMHIILFLSVSERSCPNLIETILGSCHTNLRCVLLMALVVARGGSFFLEQPSSSLMGEYFRFKWLCSAIKVPQLKWITFCNSSRIKDLNLMFLILCYNNKSPNKGSFLLKHFLTSFKVQKYNMHIKSIYNIFILYIYIYYIPYLARYEK